MNPDGPKDLFKEKLNKYGVDLPVKIKEYQEILAKDGWEECAYGTAHDEYQGFFDKSDYETETNDSEGSIKTIITIEEKIEEGGYFTMDFRKEGEHEVPSGVRTERVIVCQVENGKWKIIKPIEKVIEQQEV